MSFIAGPYQWWYTGTPALPLGVVEEPPQLEVTNFGQPVNADFLGGRAVDDIYLSSEVEISFVFQEINRTAVSALLDNFGIFGGTGYNATLGQARVGCPVGTNYADVLVGQSLPLAITGSAGCNTPDWIVARRAGLSMEQPISLLYGSRLRNVGLRLKLFPYNFVDPLNPLNANFYHIEFYTDAYYQANIASNVFDRSQAVDIVNALT